MQLEILKQYKSGLLLQEANGRTLISGHGRLKRSDDTFEDIGGSTGGFVRTVLDDWRPPDLKDFDGDWRLGENLFRSAEPAPGGAQLAGGRAQRDNRRSSLVRRS